MIKHKWKTRLKPLLVNPQLNASQTRLKHPLLLPCDLVGPSIDPACSEIFHLSASCCGNSMRSRSDGCQDQMGFSKNSTHMDSWWWPNSKRLPTQIGAAADLALPSPGVWTLSLNPRDSLEFAALGFHQKLMGFPQRKCWWINRSDRVSYSDVYAAFSLSRAGLSPVLSSVKVLSNYYMIITHCSFSQA